MEIETTGEMFEQASQMASRLVENALSSEQDVEREATTEGVYTLDVTHHLSHFAACYYICERYTDHMPAVRLNAEVIPVNFMQGVFSFPFLSPSAQRSRRILRHIFEFPPFHPAYWEYWMEGWGEGIVLQEAKENVRNSLSHFLVQRIGVMNWIRKFGAEALPPQAGTMADGDDGKGSGGTPNAGRGRGGGGGSGTTSKTTYFTVTVQTQHPGISVSSTPCYLIDWSAFGGPTRPIPGKAQYEADGQLLPGKHYFGGTGSMVPSFTQDPTVFKTPPSFRCYLTAV